MLSPSLAGQFAALTNSVPASGGTFTGAVTFSSTILVSGAATFAVGVVGTTTNDSAAAGRIGEIITGSAALDSVGSWSTNTPKNIVSIALTAGDWDVFGKAAYGGATGGTYLIASLSPTSATIGADAAAEGYTVSPFLTQANSYFTLTAGPYRASLAAPATIYLVGQLGFSVGTPLAGGFLRARRVR